MHAIPSLNAGVKAFTLTEMMVSMAVFILVVSGVISSHVIGIRMYELTQAKLGAGDQARLVLNKLSEDIRCSKKVSVGHSAGPGYFQEVASGQPQIGNSILIFPTTNYNEYIQYMLDSYSGELRRMPPGTNGTEIVAEHIKNSNVFSSEDFEGNVLTDNQNNRVIGLLMEFEQIQYPVTEIGQGKPIEYYQFRTRVTRRVLE